MRNEQARKICSSGALNFKPANTLTKVNGHSNDILLGNLRPDQMHADEALQLRSGEVEIRIFLL